MKSVPYTNLNHIDWTFHGLGTDTKFEEYEGVPLSDIAVLNPDHLHSSSIDVTASYKYLDLSCVSSFSGLITEHKEVSGEKLPARATLIVQSGDILLSTVRPERNQISIVTSDFDGCIVNSSFIVIRPKLIEQEILYFILRSPKINALLQSKARGTSIPTLKLEDVKELCIPLNSSTGDLAEEARQLFRQWVQLNQNSKDLGEITEEIFVEENLIHKYESPSITSLTKVMPYSTLSDRLDVSYYLEKPQNQAWQIPVNKLSELAITFLSGVPIPSKEYKNSGLPYVRIQDLQEGKISSDKLVFFDEQTANEKSKARLLSGDILISRVGTIGKAALAKESDEGALANQHISIVRVNPENILPEFVLLYLSTRWASEQLEQKAAGTAQRFIKLKDIKDLIVPLPSVQLQKEIVSKVFQRVKSESTDTISKEISRFTSLLI
ncbi:restriction endonuclease subunit S [Sporosarcina sp. SAFN-010]|uniref:restriction endonuclease subunit S n=1 Tax=Sporosarcina sp. SAFN-010 TaxID=3387273 RepID=UPI003F7D0A36